MSGAGDIASADVAAAKAKATLIINLIIVSSEKLLHPPERLVSSAGPNQPGAGMVDRTLWLATAILTRQ